LSQEPFHVAVKNGPSATNALLNCSAGCSLQASLKVATEFISLDDAIRQRGNELEKRGFRAFDALHLTSAESSGANFFRTCDDRVLKKAGKQKEPGARENAGDRVRLLPQVRELGFAERAVEDTAEQPAGTAVHEDRSCVNHARPDRVQRGAVAVAKIDCDGRSKSEAMFKQQAEATLGDIFKSTGPSWLARSFCG
jgi:hypothetical protein